MAPIAWAITGAGHFLAECADLVAGVPEVDLFVSRAGEEVVRMYNLEHRLQQNSRRFHRESRALASAPQVMHFFHGDYACLVVAPATGNSVAKFAFGIADNLISNLFAQAGKARLPIIVLPTDLAAAIDSIGPNGAHVHVYPRPVDLENVARLRAFPGVTVIETAQDLLQLLESYK